MSPVRLFLLPCAEGQLRSFPRAVQEDLTWALDELAENPARLPSSVAHHIVTESMEGSPALRKIVHRTSRTDPGYRGAYLLYEGNAYISRFRRRDPYTYRDLDQDLKRLLAEIPELQRHLGTGVMWSA